MKQQTKPATPEQVVTMLQAALANQTFKITRSLTYRRKAATLGFIYYKLYYVVDDKVVYDGAYLMNTRAEGQLIEKKKLNDFLISELAKQLT